MQTLSDVAITIRSFDLESARLWVGLLSDILVGIGVLLAGAAYLLSRRQTALDQLNVALAMRQQWERNYDTYLRAIAVMRWFVFPDRSSLGAERILPTDEDDETARKTAFHLAYHTSGRELEFETATRNLFAFLYQLADLLEAGLLTSRLLYTFFGRELVRHWTAIKGFVLNWPPADNFPSQRRSIVKMMDAIHSERQRRSDISEQALSDVLKRTFVEPRPDVSRILERYHSCSSDLS